ncbi:hypothetical protein OPV22_025172 [Ensete ventricosum]|uniref:Bifunctional inhibitor/plant lipid transfer protein/seed storage helical domain-containing protein n=1 Tax=Ensete ventricosum TaxID=4639 RepID=A0AAV8QC91_ENSVE|nr:hypothetical protein OPV22_025172 [Ensete ventricosum]
MNRAVAVAVALALAAIALIVAARSPPAPIGCVEELVAASACLPHVAALPEEARAPPAPSAACCKAVLAALLGAGGGPACLCHLIRRPGLFGFPVNASRVAALFSSCSSFWSPVAANSFTAFCRGQRNPPLPLSCHAFLVGLGLKQNPCSLALRDAFVFSCFTFLGFAFRVSRSSDVFRFLVPGNVAEARALPPLRSNTSTTLTEPGTGDAVTPPHDEPGRVSGPDIVVSHPTCASAQVPVYSSVGGLLLLATVSVLLAGYICSY